MDVTVVREAEADINRVWARLRDFGNMSWLPGLDRVEVEGAGIGMVRRVVPAGGQPIEETLTLLDEGSRKIGYSIKQTPWFPFEKFTGDVTLTPLGDGAIRVAWHCNFEPGEVPAKEARARFEETYGGLISCLLSA